MNILNRVSQKRIFWSTFWGWQLGLVLVILFSVILEGIEIHNMQVQLGLGMGLGVGFIQWSLLRRNNRITILWMVYSFLCLGAPFALFNSWQAPVTLKLLVMLVCGSTLLAIAQSRMLMLSASRTVQWILISIIAWFFSVLPLIATEFTPRWVNPNWLAALFNFVLIMAGGIILGLFIAPFLKRIISPVK